MNLFKRSNSFSAAAARARYKLPSNFFEDLLDHEMMVYTKFNIQYLKELLELYSVSDEYIILF